MASQEGTVVWGDLEDVGRDGAEEVGEALGVGELRRGGEERDLRDVEELQQVRHLDRRHRRGGRHHPRDRLQSAQICDLTYSG